MQPKIDQPRFFYNSLGFFMALILLAFVSCDDGRVEELEAELEQCRYELEECQEELERCQEELEDCENRSSSYSYYD
jgi:DNA repair ATPase RecN